ncbi:MAG: helix-turn-helix domain-containing protein [Deltaproteobacteria bacterium]|nr:helix-turn-helix domain-containing protein [Deltaproteobacteria bacterium]
MHYILDKRAFAQCLHERGFRGVAEFAKRAGLHRNTLHHLLAGKNVLAASFQNIADHLQVDPQALMIPIAGGSADRSLDPIRPLVARLLQRDSRLAVVLFGSRTTKRVRQYADWDLGVIRFPEPITGLEFLRLRRLAEEWSETAVPQVDLVNLHQAPATFLCNIADQVRFLDGDQASWTYFQGVLYGSKAHQ